MGGYIDQSAGLDPSGQGVVLNLGYPISGGANVADFVVPLEAAPGVDLGGGGGGTFYIDPLAGAGGVGYVDPALTAPAPTVDPTTGSMPVLDPTLAGAIGLNPTGPAPLTSIAANAPIVYGIDPATGLGTTVITDTVTGIAPGSVFDPGNLPVVPSPTVSTAGIFNAPAPASYTPPAQPTQLSVFDPSLLPVIPTATTTPYGGILPPVAAPAAPGGTSLLSKLGQAISKALGATGPGGGIAGSGPGSPSKPTAPSTAAKPTQASLLPGAAGSNWMTLLLIGLVAYVVLKEGKK